MMNRKRVQRIAALAEQFNQLCGHEGNATEGNANATEGNSDATEGNSDATEGNSDATEGNATATEGNAICGLFEKALQSGLKRPRIIFRGILEIKYVASENSRYYGKIIITDGTPWPRGVFYGWFDHGGVFRATRNCTRQVMDLLAEIKNDPVGSAAISGQRTSVCCFCGRELTTEESRSVGYGPICADKWGLPWGDVSEEVLKEKLADRLQSLSEGEMRKLREEIT